MNVYSDSKCKTGKKEKENRCAFCSVSRVFGKGLRVPLIHGKFAIRILDWYIEERRYKVWKDIKGYPLIVTSC